MAKDTVTCRYGITYTYEVKGTKGARWRLNDMLSRCCCFVCHNRECKEPHDERLEKCDHTDPYLLDCALYTKEPYCLRNKEKNQ